MIILPSLKHVKRAHSIFILIVSISINTANSQIPNLYSLNSFSIFTSVGAIANTGLSNIKGDVGTNVGAFTGFPPGNISGNIYIADSTSAAVSIQMDSVYAQIGRMVCDTTMDSLLANNVVVYPGVYCINSAAFLDGVLTFDGLSRKDSYFVIKINGAFTSAKLSEIKLYDSASSDHIFWWINGAFSLADSSIFLGSIIGNGAINLDYNSVLNGKALTRQGAVSIVYSIIDTIKQMNPLLLSINNYSIKLIDQNVHLNFQNLSEDNGLEIFNFERSVDGQIWEVINSKSNLDNLENNMFHLVDLNPLPNLSYYRLSVVSSNNISHLKAQKIFYSSLIEICISPNPNIGKFKIIYSGKENIEYLLCIRSLEGQIVYSSNRQQNEVDLRPILNGIYFAYILMDGELQVKKISIQNF